MPVARRLCSLAAIALLAGFAQPLVTAEANGPALAEESGSTTVVESATTETSQTFQNPDGTLTVEQYADAVRFRNSGGEWTDIDTSLVKRDGAWEPKASPLGLRLADGGDGAFVELEREGGDAIGLGWPTTLPEPSASGSTLTYEGALPGGDLVVTALPTGFTHSVVLRERPENPEDFRIPIPVDLDGTKIVETSTGGLQVSSSDDSTVRAPRPVMWDAETGSDGLPDEVRPVDVVISGGTDPTLALVPDAALLADPDTTYPVTIDPTFTEPSPAGDTFIQNVGSYTDGSTAQAFETLRSGTEDNGAHVSRSLIRFPVQALGGKTLLSASLKAHMILAPGCAAATTYAYRIKSSWSFSSLNWSNQPTVETSPTPPGYGAAHGGPSGSSCAAKDWATWNVLPTLKAWQSGLSTEQHGFRLSAANQTDNANLRWFRSREGTAEDPTDKPKLIYTYEPAPVAFEGEVDGVQLASGSVRVFVHLDTAAESTVSGTTVISKELPADSISLDGSKYTVRLDPRTLPDSYIADTGLVYFEVFAQNPNDPEFGTVDISARAVFDDEGNYRWIDPLAETSDAPADPNAVTSKVASDAVITSEPVDPETVDPTTIDGVICTTSTDCAPTDNPVQSAQFVMPEETASTQAPDGAVLSDSLTEPALGSDTGANEPPPGTDPSVGSTTCDVLPDPNCPIPEESGSVDEDIEPDTGMPVTGGTVVEPAQQQSGSSCPEEGSGAIRGRKYQVEVTVGTSYPMGGDKAWMARVTGSSQETVTGVGVGLMWAGHGYFEEQSKPKILETSSGFSWDPQTYKRSYRSRVEYQIVYYYYNLCRIDDGPNFTKLVPTRVIRNGGGEVRLTADPPIWTHCVEYYSSGTWKHATSRSKIYTNTTGAKLSSIGWSADFKSTRVHNQESWLKYHLTMRPGTDTYLCGKDDAPDWASKVRERVVPD